MIELKKIKLLSTEDRTKYRELLSKKRKNWYLQKLELQKIVELKTELLSIVGRRILKMFSTEENIIKKEN